jgi:glutamine synthetase
MKSDEYQRDRDRAADYLKEHDIHSVEVGFADINGSVIGKRLPARAFLNAVQSGTAICRAPLTWDIQSEYFSSSKLAGFDYGAGDMYLKPDLSTLRAIPWRPGTAFVIADAHFYSGEAIEASPRRILKRVLARLGKLGYTAKVGSEIEYYLLDRDKRPLFGGKETYSLAKVAEFSRLYEQTEDYLTKLGVAVEGLHTEYGPGQSELILEYTDALTAADNAFITKNTIKELMRKNDLYATFMAMPWSEHSASGYHLHQSLCTPDGKNAFADAGPSGEATLYQYVAGLLATSNDFLALGCPTVNSYKRLVEMSFAPTRVGVGYDNRTVSARLVGRGERMRVESRTGAADANPYLLIAASVAGGLYGLENKLPPPQIVDGNGYYDESLPALARTLGEAADHFDNSEAVGEYFGAEFAGIFSELIRYDIRAHHDVVTEWERDRYLENS